MGSYTKGRAAGRTGKDITACPYKHPEGHAGGHWVDVFRKAWEDGWKVGNEYRQSQLP